ncbi:hypothetical protein BBO99_00000183 [Phytophthora kernoviae]|uniref:Dynein light chain 1, cytoplasmic n=2 Tax=Phytophthora kernoviae TaxID=325452 RepID=A0A421H388_9STRA|nr:hypothetical protein G195_001380 [Phytophthora kernoviae 00238/432]KAG2531456.1 hypothetical protein JM18_000355 [Phytophthora kernoviae]RLM96841.1 hypothetical protein BBI17_000285 [Phytophthora kernoviae]RLN85838.1 hypothetical protein BBO99_00000183 [Phytophthora kernoviae]
MGFCGADFEVSKTPVVAVATQSAAKRAVNNAALKTQSIRDFAAALQSQLESSLGSGWHILVGGDFAVDLRYRKGACVVLFSKKSKMKVLLYRTTPAATAKPKRDHDALVENSEELNTKRKIVVFESDMEKEMKEAVIEKAKKLYNFYEGEHDNETKITQALKHSLTYAYGPTWQVVASSSRELCCLPIADPGTHADFTVTKLRVVVYRHAGTRLDQHLDSAQFGKRVAFLFATICLLVYSFLALNPSEVFERCKGSAKVASESIPVDGTVLPEGCSAEDVTRANDYTWWKTAAILGMSAFTMLASLIRMYTKSLTPKIKRSSSGGGMTKCFPSNFLFGTASSAYQVEGGWNATNREVSIWDNFCRDESNGVPCANVADDFINRYSSDIALMKQDGYGTFRFSISWSRAMSWNETTQRMQANPEGLAFYHALIDDLLANGIQPIMTLYHWDLPASLQSTLNPPGWLNEAMVDHFVDYATLIFEEFGQDVQFWTTFNEPASFILTGFALGYGPPKLGNSTTNAYDVAHVVLLSHAAAVQKFRELRDEKEGVILSTARISMVINSDWGVPLNESFSEDVAAADRKNEFHLGWFLSPLTTGDYPTVMRERIGDRLPNFTEQQSALVKGSYDLLMLNYYTSYATTDCDSERSETNCSDLTLGWANDLGVDDSRSPEGTRHAYGSLMDPNSCSSDSGYPPGYIQVIRFLHEHDTSADILLTENGWCGNETIANPDQVWYHRTHLGQVHKAIYEENIPIIGYTVWSFMDSFEWTSFAGRRGLYFVNFTDETGNIDEYSALPTQLERIQRSGGAWYSNVATTGCFEQEEEDNKYLV